MKLSRKFKKTIKKRILTTFASIALVTSTLAIVKLTGIPVSEKIDSIINQTKISVLTDFNDEASDTENADSSTAFIRGVKINDKEYLFEDNKINYDLMLEYNIEDVLTIEYLKANENQTVKGDTKVVLTKNSKTISFNVLSEDKTNKNTYTLNLTRTHSAYLKNIEINSFALSPEFQDKTTEYTVDILDNITSLKVYAIAYDKESTITIKGNENINIGSVITITVTNPYVTEPMVYSITCEKALEENNYSYSGGYQEFTVPYTGTYKFECWGARGGKSRINGSLGGTPGKGGYAKGEILLKKGEKYYVYIGQQGTDAVVGKDSAATWNGGGLGTWDHSDNETSGAGGGATDIRLVGGNWNNSESLASRIMVAGGGGGASWTYKGGAGGGISGSNGVKAKSGTQTTGYSFGIGQNASGTADNDGVGGGRRWLLGWIHEQ